MCEAWEDARYAGGDYGKMYDLLLGICEYLCREWQDVGFVALDLLVFMLASVICSICVGHCKMHDLLLIVL